MRKLFLIAWHEYKKYVLRKRFIGALLAPLLFMAFGGIVAVITVQSFADSDAGVVGYVDPAHALATAHRTADAETQVTFTSFESKGEADAALKKENIRAYYVLASDFAQTGHADLFYWKRNLSDEIRNDFERYARSAVLSPMKPQIAERLEHGIDFTFETPDRSRSFGENNIVGFVLPFVFGLIFFIALFAGAQYLMQAVIEEKENRTMEVLISTVTPTQLMGGKILGLGALGLTQVGVWLSAVAIGLAIASQRLTFLQGVQIAPTFIAVALVLFVLEYVLFGSVMAAIGSAVLDQKQAQQYMGPFVLLAISPEFFIPVIFLDPNGVIATILTLFPFTAPLALVFRYGLTTVPVWQIVVAVVLLIGFAAGGLWLAGRVFRLGMLRYGKAVAFREIVAEVRS